MSLLEGVGLGILISLPLRALICIMSCLLALETHHSVKVLLSFRVGTMLSISMVMSIVIVSFESSIVTLVSTIVVVAMMLVAISIIVVVPMLVIIAFREMVPLVCYLRMNLSSTELPLPVLFLPHVVVQSDGLIQQSLIVWGISHRQWYLQLSLKTCLLYTSDAADEEDSVDLGG